MTRTLGGAYANGELSVNASVGELSKPSSKHRGGIVSSTSLSEAPRSVRWCVNVN